MQPRFGTLGTLTLDDEEDRLQCHVCGRWYRNLAQHARLAHHLDADAYRELAGLNRSTPLISPGRQAELRESTAPLIARLRAEGKLRHWGEDRERFQRDKAAAVETLHREGLSMEGRRHRREGVTDELREQQRERRRARNLAGTDRATPEAIRAGLKRAAGTGTCGRCGMVYERSTPHQRYCTECAVVVEREQGRESARRARLRKRHGEDAAPRRADSLSIDQRRETQCARCGETFTAASHRERYCEPCRPLATREYQRIWQGRRRIDHTSD